MDQSFEAFAVWDWEDFFVEAVAPVMLGWFATYAVIGLCRWVWAGFKPKT